MSQEIKREEKESRNSIGLQVKKVYKPVQLEAKNAPYGSYAAGCRPTYGDGENCYICDYGG